MFPILKKFLFWGAIKILIQVSQNLSFLWVIQYKTLAQYFLTHKEPAHTDMYPNITVHEFVLHLLLILETKFTRTDVNLCKAKRGWSSSNLLSDKLSKARSKEFSLLLQKAEASPAVERSLYSSVKHYPRSSIMEPFKTLNLRRQKG